MMKTVVIALALLSGCALAVRTPAPAEAPTALGSNCPSTTVYDVVEENGLTTFLSALEADDQGIYLDNSTSYPLTYTVFAPTNAALESALAEQGISGISGLKESGLLDPILQYHFIITPYTEAQLESRGTVGTNYKNETLQISPGGVITAFNSTATIIKPNLVACDSIVHIIDGVLIPDFSKPQPPTRAPATSST